MPYDTFYIDNKGRIIHRKQIKIISKMASYKSMMVIYCVFLLVADIEGFLKVGKLSLAKKSGRIQREVAEKRDLLRDKEIEKRPHGERDLRNYGNTKQEVDIPRHMVLGR